MRRIVDVQGRDAAGQMGDASLENRGKMSHSINRIICHAFPRPVGAAGYGC